LERLTAVSENDGARPCGPRSAREAAVASLTTIKNNLRQLIQQRVDGDFRNADRWK
jgi:hypothetical protein